MPDTKIIAGGQNHQPVDLVTGRIAVPSRVVAISPTVQHAELENGDQHLALPEWTPEGGGPMAFNLAAPDGGANLTGMGAAVSIDTVEYSLLGALIIILVTQSAITTTVDDPASPVGSRFAAAVTIASGTAQMFVCGSVGGEKKWFPIAYAP